VKVKFLVSLFAVILAPGFVAAGLIAAQVDKIDKIACLSNFEGPFFGITMYFSSFVFYTLVFTMIISRIKKNTLSVKPNEPNGGDTMKTHT
jgi:hypothetical protein